MKNKNDSDFNENELIAIRQNIMRQRKLKGMTQVELAQLMGVTQRVISYYENEAQTITLDAISKISKALDIPRKRILDTGTDLPEPMRIPKALQKRLEKVRDLSPKAQKTVSDLIDALVKAEKYSAEG
jgi:transcriptional regulator with XRE-family HTH domain